MHSKCRVVKSMTSLPDNFQDRGFIWVHDIFHHSHCMCFFKYILGCFWFHPICIAYLPFQIGQFNAVDGNQCNNIDIAFTGRGTHETVVLALPSVIYVYFVFCLLIYLFSMTILITYNDLFSQ